MVRLWPNFRSAMLGVWIACSLVGLPGCGWCDYAIQSVAMSPDRHYEAVLEVSDCGGAASSGTFDVKIYRLPRHDSRWPWMSSPREAVFGASYAYHLKLEWSDKSHLIISCPGCSGVEVYHLKPSWEGISVQYAQTGPPQGEAR
jgi:hypothetical protein